MPVKTFQAACVMLPWSAGVARMTHALPLVLGAGLSVGGCENS